MSIVLLIARLIVGLGFMAHGSQKIFGSFGGHGLKGTAGFFESLGLKPGILHATAAGLAELIGGLLVLLGFLGPVGPALIIIVMLVAIATVHWKNGFFTPNGWELNAAYIALAIIFIGAGFGMFSLDAMLFGGIHGTGV
jgi:putative oxidoreductase